MTENSLYNDYGDWVEISKKDSLEIKKQITGSHQNSTNYTLNFESNYISLTMKEQIVKITNNNNNNNNNNNIIDFGCGFGRNILLLKIFFDKIYGYDITDMLLSFKKLNDINYNSYEKISDNLNYILNNNNIQYLYDSVVFQHIISDEYNEYIANIINLSNIKYLIGLTSELNLYNVKQWKILLEKYNFKVLYKESEEETFGIPHLFVILEKN